MKIYKCKLNAGKGNINILVPDRALQVSAMPLRFPGVLPGLRLRTDGSEGRRHVCGSHSIVFFYTLHGCISLGLDNALRNLCGYNDDLPPSSVLQSRTESFSGKAQSSLAWDCNFFFLGSLAATTVRTTRTDSTQTKPPTVWGQTCPSRQTHPRVYGHVKAV